MKKIVGPFLVLCAAIFSCWGGDEGDKAKHELKKFNVKTSVSTESHAYYFLVIGGYSSTTREETKVRFYFKNCEGSFQFCEMNLRNVKVATDNNSDIPYVVFDTGDNPRCYDRHGYFYSATIHCKESDFQTDININDLK